VSELRPFYDVIVVGAGSAGAVVAQTLATLLPSKSILVIESGPSLDTTAPVSREPANSPNLFVAQSDGRRQQPPQAFTRRSVLRPGEARVPADTALALPNYLQGRGWGGSGAINGLVCAPGKPADYNRWAHEYGCIGWSWADLAPVFAELQSQLFISTPSMYQAADEALLAAYTSLGSDQLQLTPAALSVSPVESLLSEPSSEPFTEPFSEPLTEIPATSPSTQSSLLADRPPARSQQGPDGVAEPNATLEQESTSVSLRRKLLGLTQHLPSNLHVLSGTDVVRILTDDRIVRGVQLADGTEVQSTRVVLSAGAIGSPVLLQRSGIGRPGVGQNLHDHTSVSVTLQLPSISLETHFESQPSGQSSPEQVPHRPAILAQTDKQPPVLRPPTSALSNSATLDEAFTPTNVVIESSDHIQILPVSPLAGETNLGVWMASPFQAIHGRGSVTALLDCTTEVQFDSFSDERDRTQLRNAARLLGQLLEQLSTSPDSLSAMQPVDPQLAEQLRTLSDNELDTWVLHNQGSYYHAAGTCRMGPADDPRSVVDPTCAVLGWSNISVIDASIFPDLPTANPYLPTVAVAKLAATRLATRLRT
jgi:choline dehydrogenase-like flavoprotein